MTTNIKVTFRRADSKSPVEWQVEANTTNKFLAVQVEIMNPQSLVCKVEQYQSSVGKGGIIPSQGNYFPFKAMAWSGEAYGVAPKETVVAAGEMKQNETFVTVTNQTP